MCNNVSTCHRFLNTLVQLYSSSSHLVLCTRVDLLITKIHSFTALSPHLIISSHIPSLLGLYLSLLSSVNYVPLSYLYHVFHPLFLFSFHSPLHLLLLSHSLSPYSAAVQNFLASRVSNLSPSALFPSDP